MKPKVEISHPVAIERRQPLTGQAKNGVALPRNQQQIQGCNHGKQEDGSAP